MDFQLHESYTEVDPLEWNSLLDEAITNTPFQRHEYQSGWWETLGGGEWKQGRLVLVTAREADRLRGIAPLFLTEHENRPALLLTGSIEISDYLDLIIRSADVEPFVSDLLDFLHKSFPVEWGLLDLYNIPEDSPTLPALKAESLKRGWVYTVEVFRPTPYIPLPTDFEDYLAALDKKQRHEIRRKLRRIEEAGNEVSWYISDGTQLEEDISTFLDLMGNDAEKTRFLTPAMRTQMSGLIHTAHSHGWLWLAFLEINGRKAAAALNFDYQGKLWGYNSGADRNFMELSPGWVLLTHNLKWAIENGRSEFDFLRGDEAYKYRFGALKRQVMRVRLERAR